MYNATVIPRFENETSVPSEVLKDMLTIMPSHEIDESDAGSPRIAVNKQASASGALPRVSSGAQLFLLFSFLIRWLATA